MSYEKTIHLYDDEIGLVSYVEHMGTSKTVVNAARVSFGKDNNSPFDEKDQKLVKYLYEHKHTSPFEHLLVTFKFVVPLFVARQHMRHRTWKMNEISRRYTSKDIQFYTPKQFRKQHESNRQASMTDDLINPVLIEYEPRPDSPESTTCYYYRADGLMKEHYDNSLELYSLMIDKGICKEQARMILPVGIYTEYYGTIDLHNLFSFIELRTHEGAQWEIQVVAKACKEIAADLWPEIFNIVGK